MKNKLIIMILKNNNMVNEWHIFSHNEAGNITIIPVVRRTLGMIKKNSNRHRKKILGNIFLSEIQMLGLRSAYIP